MSEKIEIGYRHIGTQAGKEYHHKFLLYTNKDGQQYTISGWSDDKHSTKELPYGKLQVLAQESYDNKNPDYPKPNQYGNIQKQYRETIIQDNDLSKIWQSMILNALSKNNNYPYDPLKQNSNTLADSILKDLHLPAAQQDGFTEHWSPASHNQLNKFLKPKQLNDASDLISEINLPVNQEIEIAAIDPNILANIQNLLNQRQALLQEPNQFGFSQAALEQADKMMQERLAQNQNQSQGRSLG